jgi:hypothetical protein
MKSWILIGAIAASCLTANEQKLPAVKTIIPLTELTPESTDIAVYCQEGTELPLKLFAKTKLFSLAWLPNLTIRVEKTCYVRWYHGELYGSFDLENWDINLADSELKDTFISVDKHGILFNIDATADAPAYDDEDDFAED